ncbi:MAG: hypothetical protein IBX47_13140 [Desulfuromonadales bacterium]|nr:hypothetical protein [Desulfuromonadales bacterium]
MRIGTRFRKRRVLTPALHGCFFARNRHRNDHHVPGRASAYRATSEQMLIRLARSWHPRSLLRATVVRA